jgi:hypothetical protein
MAIAVFVEAATCVAPVIGLPTVVGATGTALGCSLAIAYAEAGGHLANVSV